jgi:hypothetical protein
MVRGKGPEGLSEAMLTMRREGRIQLYDDGSGDPLVVKTGKGLTPPFSPALSRLRIVLSKVFPQAVESAEAPALPLGGRSLFVCLKGVFIRCRHREQLAVLAR